MATNGLISIVDKEKVLYKIVVGCGGMNIDTLVECIKITYREAKDKINAYYLYHTALNYHFGCKDCLVVFNEEELEADNKELFHGSYPLFLKTFDNPKFNPRWECGIADYTEIIDISKLEKEEFDD